MKIQLTLEADSSRTPEEVRAELEELLARGLVRIGLREKGITNARVVSARPATPDTPLVPPRIA